MPPSQNSSNPETQGFLCIINHLEWQVLFNHSAYVLKSHCSVTTSHLFFMDSKKRVLEDIVDTRCTQ